MLLGVPRATHGPRVFWVLSLWFLSVTSLRAARQYGAIRLFYLEMYGLFWGRSRDISAAWWLQCTPYNFCPCCARPTAGYMWTGDRYSGAGYNPLCMFLIDQRNTIDGGSYPGTSVLWLVSVMRRVFPAPLHTPHETTRGYTHAVFHILLAVAVTVPVATLLFCVQSFACFRAVTRDLRLPPVGPDRQDMLDENLSNCIYNAVEYISRMPNKQAG